MSKFGSSYPPGVTESMLPGNSKEEQEAEAMVDSLYTTVAPLRPSIPTPRYEELEDEVVTALEKIVSEAYAKGRDDAKADMNEAEEYARERSEQRRTIPPLNVHIMLGIVTDYLEAATELMPAGIPCSGEEIDAYRDTKEQFTVWAARARELLKQNYEAIEQPEPVVSVCVACGMTEFDCVCEVRDFENK